MINKETLGIERVLNAGSLMLKSPLLKFGKPYLPKKFVEPKFSSSCIHIVQKG